MVRVGITLFMNLLMSGISVKKLTLPTGVFSTLDLFMV